MDYKRIYDMIIMNAKKKNRSKTKHAYYERHHIIPRCMNGTNDKENLVLLTAREHYIAHKLLWKIYPDNVKLLYALYRFVNGNSEQMRNGLTLSSKEISNIRETAVKSLRNREPWNKGLKMDKNFKKKISKSLTGNKRRLGIKHSEKTKNKMSISAKGRITWNKKIEYKGNIYLAKDLAKKLDISLNELKYINKSKTNKEK